MIYRKTLQILIWNDTLQDYFDYMLGSEGNRWFLIYSLGAIMFYIFIVP